MISLNLGSMGDDMIEAEVVVGQEAPDFSLPASTGTNPLALSSLRGKIVVLAFYILDFTGG